MEEPNHLQVSNFFFQELDTVDFGTAWENHQDQDIKHEIKDIHPSNTIQDDGYNNTGFVPDVPFRVLAKQL